MKEIWIKTLSAKGEDALRKNLSEKVAAKDRAALGITFKKVIIEKPYSMGLIVRLKMMENMFGAGKGLEENLCFSMENEGCKRGEDFEIEVKL